MVFIGTVLGALHVVALDEALDSLLDIGRLEKRKRKRVSGDEKIRVSSTTHTH